MNLTRRTLISLFGMGSLGLAGCAGLGGAGGSQDGQQNEPQEEPVDVSKFEPLAIDMDAWNYDEVVDCYYQLSLPYCLEPGSEQYESLAVFVPGAYFEGTPKGSLYSCTINEGAKVGAYTPTTAPVAMPINSPSCSAQESPTSYTGEGLQRYLDAGIVYVYAGFKGRSGGYESATQEYYSGGAPWLAADLKAAIRCLRYNASVLPCDTSRIFVFGLGVGGGVGSLLGVSGNAEVYQPYLEALGAATHDAEGNELTDEVCGVAGWCTMGAFESSDSAYEWMMGQYSSEGSRSKDTWTGLLSKDLADAYGDYVNGLALEDDDANPLQLDRIEDGSYAGGGYYTHLIGVIEDAAADFFQHTEFPYTYMPVTRQGFFPGDPSLRATMAAQADSKEGEGDAQQVAGVRHVEATVYETLESYIATLNGDNRWLTFNAGTGAVDVTGLWGFVPACRLPERDVCAYDAIDRSGIANQLFGTDDQPSLHFDAMVAKLVESEVERYAAAQGWDEEVVAAWRGDLVEQDVLEKTVAERVEMSDPLALFKSITKEGQTAGVAPYWRLRTGLFQSETTLVGEMNLALALAAHRDVWDVSYETVWGAGFGLVERQGDPQDNLVAWIKECCPAKATSDAEVAENESAEANK